MKGGYIQLHTNLWETMFAKIGDPVACYVFISLMAYFRKLINTTGKEKLDSHRLASFINVSEEELKRCLSLLSRARIVHFRFTGRAQVVHITIPQYIDLQGSYVKSVLSNRNRGRIDPETEEKRIEIEKEGEIDASTSIGEGQDSIPYSEIISDLNSRAGTDYSPGDRETRRLIHERWQDGFRLDAFKTVNRKKADEWLDTKMAGYLRPETLYGPKFEGYLKAPEAKNQKSDVDPSHTEYPDLSKRPMEISYYDKQR